MSGQEKEKEKEDVIIDGNANCYLLESNNFPVLQAHFGRGVYECIYKIFFEEIYGDNVIFKNKSDEETIKRIPRGSNVVGVEDLTPESKKNLLDPSLFTLS